MNEMQVESLERQVRRAVNWLWSVRLPDDAWAGVPSVTHSNPVDSAAVLFGILEATRVGATRMDEHSTKLQQSLEYLRKKGQEIPDSWSHAVKGYVWVTLALHAAGEPSSSPIMNYLMNEMEKFRVAGEGWANTLGGSTHTHNTGLGIVALMRRGIRRKQVDESVAWLLSSQNPDGGWGWFKGHMSNNVCTAMSILALIEAIKGESKQVEKAVNWLQGQQQQIAGFEGRWIPTPEFEQKTKEPDSLFIHFSSAYVLVALLKAGVPLSSKVIKGGVEYMLKLQRDNGGWPYTDGYLWFECKMSALNWSTGKALWAMSNVLERMKAE